MVRRVGPWWVVLVLGCAATHEELIAEGELLEVQGRYAEAAERYRRSYDRIHTRPYREQDTALLAHPKDHPLTRLLDEHPELEQETSEVPELRRRARGRDVDALRALSDRLDPLSPIPIGSRGVVPDAGEAARWYRSMAMADSVHALWAADRLAALLRAHPQLYRADPDDDLLGLHDRIHQAAQGLAGPRAEEARNFLRTQGAVAAVVLVQGLQEPTLQEPCHEILTELSGKSYPPTPDEWRAWLETQP